MAVYHNYTCLDTIQYPNHKKAAANKTSVPCESTHGTPLVFGLTAGGYLAVGLVNICLKLQVGWVVPSGNWAILCIFHVERILLHVQATPRRQHHPHTAASVRIEPGAKHAETRQLSIRPLRAITKISYCADKMYVGVLKWELSHSVKLLLMIRHRVFRLKKCLIDDDGLCREWCSSSWIILLC